MLHDAGDEPVAAQREERTGCIGRVWPVSNQDPTSERAERRAANVFDQAMQTVPANLPVWPLREIPLVNNSAEKRKSLLAEPPQDYVLSRLALRPPEQRVSHRPITKSVSEIHHRWLAELEEEHRLVVRQQDEIEAVNAAKTRHRHDARRAKEHAEASADTLFGPKHLNSISAKFGRPRLEAAVKSFTVHHNTAPTPDHRAYITPLQRCQHAVIDPALVAHPLFKSHCSLCCREQLLAEQMTGWSRLQDYTFLDGLKRRNGPTADVMWAKLRHGVHSGVPGGVGMGGIGVNEWNLHDSVHKHQQRAAIDAVKGVKVLLKMPDNGKTYALGRNQYGHRYL